MTDYESADRQQKTFNYFYSLETERDLLSNSEFIELSEKEESLLSFF